MVKAARASVAANEVALAGVREKEKVGQRTTLDVLNAQQALLSAAPSWFEVSTTKSTIPITCSGGRPGQRADAGARGRRVQPECPLQPGQEQVDRGPDARREISVDRGAAADIGLAGAGDRRLPLLRSRNSGSPRLAAGGRAAIGRGRHSG